MKALVRALVSLAFSCNVYHVHKKKTFCRWTPSKACPDAFSSRGTPSEWRNQFVWLNFNLMQPKLAMNLMFGPRLRGIRDMTSTFPSLSPLRRFATRVTAIASSFDSFAVPQPAWKPRFALSGRCHTSSFQSPNELALCVAHYMSLCIPVSAYSCMYLVSRTKKMWYGALLWLCRNT